MAKGGKFTMGNKMDAVRGQAKGAEKSFNPKAPKGISTSSPGKGYSPPPQVGGGKADKVSGVPGAKTADSVSGVGGGRKLGNHYSNT
jgi:hypothetical protein